MTDYANIINDLLSINDTMFAISTSNKNIDNISIRMAFDKNWHNIAEHAAAAIEVLNNLVTLNTERCEGLRKQLREAQEQYEKHINELEAQLPKRGEWIHGREIGKEWAYDHWIIYYEDWHCSNCKVVFEQDEKPKYNYCPNCGAKMMEVQDADR